MGELARGGAVSKRQQSRKDYQTLRVQVDAEALLKHTFTKTRNLHIYPKKDRGGLPTRTMNAAADVLADIMAANDLRLDDLEERRERYSLQRSALRNVRLLISYIKLAYECLPLDIEAFEYWSSLADNVRIEIAAWIKSDKERIARM